MKLICFLVIIFLLSYLMVGCDVWNNSIVNTDENYQSTDPETSILQTEQPTEIVYSNNITIEYHYFATRENVKITEEQLNSIRSIFGRQTWQASGIKSIYDYELIFDDKTFYYVSDDGIISNITDDVYVFLSEEDKQQMNAILYPVTPNRNQS